MSKHQGFSAVALVIILAVLAFGGYSVWKKQAPTLTPISPTDTNIEPATSPSTPSVDMAGWKTYRNDKYGFEVKYPSEYLVKENLQALSNKSVVFKDQKMKFGVALMLDPVLGFEEVEDYRSRERLQVGTESFEIVYMKRIGESYYTLAGFPNMGSSTTSFMWLFNNDREFSQNDIEIFKKIISSFVVSKLPIATLLPVGAKIEQTLHPDLDGDGITEFVAVYKLTITNPFTYKGASPLAERYGLLIAKNVNQEWQVLVDEMPTQLNEFSSVGNIIGSVVKSQSSPKQGLLVSNDYVGANTSQGWDVWVIKNGKVAKLDPKLLRKDYLDKLGLVDQVHNVADMVNEFTIREKIPGYTPSAARCCPDRSTEQLFYIFDGASLTRLPNEGALL